jgi:hypothetical protein
MNPSVERNTGWSGVKSAGGYSSEPEETSEKADPSSAAPDEKPTAESAKGEVLSA